MNTLGLIAIFLEAIVIVLLVFVLKRRSGGDVVPLQKQLESIERGQERGDREFRDEVARNREESNAQARSLRQEMGASVQRLSETVLQQMVGLGGLQKQQLEGFAGQLDSLRTAVETKLGQIQTDNAGKLEEMRRTVDEKLSGTLDRRLGESFKIVSDRLEQVHKGLGEMQTLASGVGDLKKVLTNIKVRGIWGEVQLGNILEQLLTPDQYEKNVVTKKGGAERVEYAIKLPGHDDQDDQSVWLPIDAKFPKEDYERLVDASDRADAAAVEEAGKQLENRIKLEAKAIRDKYIDPPHTTDFAILFLPTESLYAEILRKPGLHDLLQRDYRVTVAGPTTLAAILNSFQMGFRTLAIQKRSGEVWNLLGAVKTEFRKFGEVIEKVETKIREAGNVIEKAKTRSRAIERKLKGVEELPAPAAQAILGPAEAADVEDEETIQEDGAADPEKS
ncbi:MAG: DNA recombination protein RmuC [Candidatus Aminicenantes bacterium]|nr:DNA recombination protein RmuC [Candidatus Aminicenantes bacterium]